MEKTVVSKEELLKKVEAIRKQKEKIKQLSKTELGREMLRQKGIKPIQ